MIMVLVVEDDPGVRFFYKQVIELNNFELVGMAENGEEAVEIFKSLPVKPDVILMDHRMPLKSGLDASREILNMNGRVKIIFATADNSIEEEAREIGAHAVIDKPFTVDVLVKKIRNACKEKDTVDEE